MIPKIISALVLIHLNYTKNKGIKQFKNIIISLALISTPILMLSISTIPIYSQNNNSNNEWEYLGDVEIHGKPLSSDGYHLYL